MVHVEGYDIRGTLLGSLVEGDPTIWGSIFGVPCFVSPPYVLWKPLESAPPPQWAFGEASSLPASWVRAWAGGRLLWLPLGLKRTSLLSPSLSLSLSLSISLSRSSLTLSWCTEHVLLLHMLHKMFVSPPVSLSLYLFQRGAPIAPPCEESSGHSSNIKVCPVLRAQCGRADIPAFHLIGVT